MNNNDVISFCAECIHDLLELRKSELLSSCNVSCEYRRGYLDSLNDLDNLLSCDFLQENFEDCDKTPQNV